MRLYPLLHPRHWASRLPAELAITAAAAGLIGACRPRTTASLDDATRARLAAEGIVRSADDLTFRYSVGSGRSNASWEDRPASIVVTRASVLIHKNQKVGIDLRAGRARGYAVERAGTRIRIRHGSGRSAEIWSFDPPDDASGWTADIRSVITSSDTTH
jgi:hypothetical protein